MPIYAEGRIPEYWILNVVECQIEVYRAPDGLTYQARRFVQADERIAPLAIPHAELVLRELFTED